MSCNANTRRSWISFIWKRKCSLNTDVIIYLIFFHHFYWFCFAFFYILYLLYTAYAHVNDYIHRLNRPWFSYLNKWFWYLALIWDLLSAPWFWHVLFSEDIYVHDVVATWWLLNNGSYNRDVKYEWQGISFFFFLSLLLLKQFWCLCFLLITFSFSAADPTVCQNSSCVDFSNGRFWPDGKSLNLEQCDSLVLKF